MLLIHSIVFSVDGLNLCRWYGLYRFSLFNTVLNLFILPYAHLVYGSRCCLVFHYILLSYYSSRPGQMHLGCLIKITGKNLSALDQGWQFLDHKATLCSVLLDAARLQPTWVSHCLLLPECMVLSRVLIFASVMDTKWYLSVLICIFWKSGSWKLIYLLASLISPF